MKVREVIAHIGPIPIVIPLKLFLEGIDFLISLLLLTFVFVKPIRSAIDPTYTSRIIVHGFA